MTPEGAAKLREELNNLKSVERPRVIQMIAVAREHGDLSENAEYHAAKERQGMIVARINHIEQSLSRAEVIDPSKLSGSKIQFGARVRLLNVDTDKEETFQIVGPEEVVRELRRASRATSTPAEVKVMCGRVLREMIKFEEWCEPLFDVGEAGLCAGDAAYGGVVVQAAADELRERQPRCFPRGVQLVGKAE